MASVQQLINMARTRGDIYTATSLEFIRKNGRPPTPEEVPPTLPRGKPKGVDPRKKG